MDASPACTKQFSMNSAASVSLCASGTGRDAPLWRRQPALYHVTWGPGRCHGSTVALAALGSAVSARKQSRHGSRLLVTKTGHCDLRKHGPRSLPLGLPSLLLPPTLGPNLRTGPSCRSLPCVLLPEPRAIELKMNARARVRRITVSKLAGERVC